MKKSYMLFIVLSSYIFVLKSSSFTLEKPVSCYELLGISPKASMGSIREAYVRKIMLAHNDRRGMVIVHDELTSAYWQACAFFSISKYVEFQKILEEEKQAEERWQVSPQEILAQELIDEQAITQRQLEEMTDELLKEVNNQ